jgi:deoxyhypusine synthase
MEKNLNDLEEVLAEVFKQMPQGQRFGSQELCAHMGRVLDQQTGGHTRGIVVACSRKGVPIYIPAFTDSELGLDLAVSLIERRMSETGATLNQVLEDFHSPFDPFRDLGHYTRFVGTHSRLGIFTIGGGVPRNWAQQAPCFLDVVRTALREEGPLNRFRYGVRICPEPVHLGGLSGCSYSEGVSWGKFVPKSEGGRYAEVHADATIAWPILVKALSQRLEKRQNIDDT